jgi:hypothetical protein
MRWVEYVARRIQKGCMSDFGGEKLKEEAA